MTLDLGGGNGLRESSLAAEDEWVAFDERDPVDDEAVLGFDFDPLEAMRDVRAGRDERAQDDFGRLGAAPVGEFGAEFHALAAKLMAHQALLDGLRATRGVAGQRERLRDGEGRRGRLRGLDGGEFHGVGIVEALFLQRRGEAVLFPDIVLAVEQPPQRVLPHRALSLFRHFQHGQRRFLVGIETDGGQGIAARFFRQVGGKGAGFEGGDALRGVQAPGEGGEFV